MSGKVTKRTRQVADMIQRELATALRQEIKDPRLTNVVITDVVVTPDLKLAKVYFSLLNENELPAAQAALDKASGHFRHLIATRMELRYTPALHFYYDQTIVNAEHMDQLLKKVPINDQEK
ncbi:MAG: 30S ribosome-binding factor RbfA [Proteobacteria bacterium]|nr:30S ribosome-binding factor RbfA [Pseudomonadota bacterium]